MLSWQTHLIHQLEELHLIRSSLLAGERFAFVLPSEDHTTWSSLLDAFTDASGLDAVPASLTHPPCQARFRMSVVAAQMSFEVELPPCTDITDPASSASANTAASVSVRGDHVSRDAQERWHAEIRARFAEIDDACAFPVYELLTLLMATLHESLDVDANVVPDSPHASAPSPSVAPSLPSEPLYHAFLTSHHLISPVKRRSMHRWSSLLAVTGFAKVGYPGIVYAEGTRDAVETFVRNVRGMQWLALRVRFVEPVPSSGSGSSPSVCCEPWVEVTKISEVLAQMRMRGREDLVTTLGVGVPSKESKH